MTNEFYERLRPAQMHSDEQIMHIIVWTPPSSAMSMLATSHLPAWNWTKK